MGKAQISVQFNWIFIIIIGGIILLFFLTVIKSQVKEADYELAGDILRSLDTIIKTSEQKPASINIIKIPNVPLNFVCEPGLSYYNIGSGGQNDITYDIIFAQKKMSGKTLISWTQSWDVPFRIATFQYLTTRNTRFIVVDDNNDLDDDSIANELYDMLPGNISKELILQGGDVIDYNYDHYRIIQFKNYIHEGDIPDPELVQKITIEAEEGLDSYGEITFEDEVVDKKVNFVKKAALFGAIFSENADYYECTMDKAYDRLDLLMELNNDTVTTISDARAGTECTVYYDWAKDYFNNIIEAIRLHENDPEIIYDNSKSLKNDNENLIRGPDCPLIY